MTTSSALLEINDLHVEIPTPGGLSRPVRGVSLRAARGDSLGLVGESGSGKTLTLRAVLGLLPGRGRVSRGAVRFDGEDLTAAPPARLRGIRGRRVAMVFQEPMSALNPVMRIGEQIAEGPRRHLGLDHARARERAVELMERVGIADPRRRLRAYPHELSGGMRQRVMIAIALSSDPELLLCDEPTTALDVTVQSQILRLLRSLREETGLTLVYVSHDLAVITETCGRLAVMYAGTIVETGSVAELIRAPRHPYTMGLLRSVPDVDAPADRLSGIPGAPPDPRRPAAGCAFHPRCEYAGDDCLTGVPPLAVVAGDHRTACLHWRRLDHASAGEKR